MAKCVRPKIRVGDRVLLAAFEDQPEETAEVLGVEKDGRVLTVCVDVRQGEFDDGIRELEMDQVLRVLPEPRSDSLHSEGL
jgi:hypothetical protein